MGDLQTTQNKYIKLGIGDLPQSALDMAAQRAGHILPNSTEAGMRATPENSLVYMYRQMGIDYSLRATILDIREMDKCDPRVKKIHGRTARSLVKGGLILKKENNKRIIKLWNDFQKKLNLNKQEKLESDARGLMMEGNLPIQWVASQTGDLVAGIRMPTETLRPVVNKSGRIIDPLKAYEQIDILTGQPIASFSLWQLTLARLDPDNYDDQGSLGRPYLDAARGPWKKLNMTEQDLVMRRRSRAVPRLRHELEGATKPEMDEYEADIRNRQMEGITTDYFTNKKGSVTTIEGDANLDQIADVVHLLDTFFSGAPAPKGLFGYAGELSRDILEDLKQDFYEEIDAMQDTQAFAYESGFRLFLLLKGINPDAYDFEVAFKERRTETANQAADRGLKLQALGASRQTVFETVGLDKTVELDRLETEVDEFDPYPESSANGGTPGVTITPGNAPKKESATSIDNK